MRRYLFTLEVFTYRKTKSRFGIQISMSPAHFAGVGFLLLNQPLSLSHLAGIVLVTAAGINPVREPCGDGRSDGPSDHY
jgi:threonine/homoserine efflux transporter RhtA